MSNEIIDTTAIEANQQAPILTLKQFTQTYSWPTESGLRAYAFRAAELGMESAFLRIGRRLLIDPMEFFALIRKCNRPLLSASGFSASDAGSQKNGLKCADRASKAHTPVRA